MGLKKIHIPELSSFLINLEHQLGAKNSTLEIPMTLLMHEISHSFHLFFGEKYVQEMKLVPARISKAIRRTMRLSKARGWQGLLAFTIWAYLGRKI